MIGGRLKRAGANTKQRGSVLVLRSCTAMGSTTIHYACSQGATIKHRATGGGNSAMPHTPTQNKNMGPTIFAIYGDGCCYYCFMFTVKSTLSGVNQRYDVVCKYIYSTTSTTAVELYHKHKIWTWARVRRGRNAAVEGVRINHNERQFINSCGCKSSKGSGVSSNESHTETNDKPTHNYQWASAANRHFSIKKTYKHTDRYN